MTVPYINIWTSVICFRFSYFLRRLLFMVDLLLYKIHVFFLFCGEFPYLIPIFLTKKSLFSLLFFYTLPHWTCKFLAYIIVAFLTSYRTHIEDETEIYNEQVRINRRGYVWNVGGRLTSRGAWTEKHSLHRPTKIYLPTTYKLKKCKLISCSWFHVKNEMDGVLSLPSWLFYVL